jgi:RNA 2',3'-cyclic 3'-phosphodiesterase
MRLFIAIELPGEIKKQMAEAQRRLKGAGVDASWTRSGGVHLTLKFLGEIPEPKVPEIISSLTGAASGSGKFRLEVAGVGAFPNPRNARVVWIGVSGDIEKLTGLQAAIEDAMVRLGMEREERKFTPHLTLGRIRYIRSKESWLGALEELRDIRLPGFDVTSVSLMKSELRPSGAEYAEMGRVELS